MARSKTNQPRGTGNGPVKTPPENNFMFFLAGLLVVPLVGAFFIDLLNAVTIKFFIGVISEWLV